MGVSGARGKFFLFLNSIYWLLGLVTLGYGVWILLSTNNTNNFLSGTLVFTYSFLGIGILVGLTGLLGCIGGCCESTCALKAFLGLMVTLLLIDIGVIIAGYVQRNNVFDIMDKLWDEINTDTKDQIQKELSCCGFSGPSEYLTKKPDSCYSDSQDAATLFTTSCETAMKDWVESNIPIWAGVLGAIGFIQILCMIVSCLVLNSVEKAMRVSDSGSE